MVLTKTIQIDTKKIICDTFELCLSRNFNGKSLVNFSLSPKQNKRYFEFNNIEFQYDLLKCGKSKEYFTKFYLKQPDCAVACSFIH